MSANRIAKDDYRVSADLVIEKGTWIKVPIYGIHRDPDIYKQPEVFDPDRFSGAEVKKRHPMSWLPFGDGPRSCIALRFAMMEMQIALVVLLSSFEVSTCSKTVELITIHPKRALITPDRGTYLRLRPIYE